MKHKIWHWLPVMLLIVGLIMGGCGTQQAASLNSSDPSNTQANSIITSSTDMSQQFIDYVPRLEGTATVVMTVKGSPITIEVNGNEAPITAGNFVDLVKRGFYNGLVFHRVVREPQPFVVQGGDPKGNGTGGFVDPETSQDRNIPLEIKPQGTDTPLYSQTFQMAKISVPPELTHTRGAVAMARSQMPDSASSQFYFALTELPFLDGSYAVFGQVTEGMEIVDEIQQGDRIDSAEVTQGLENLKT
ncbi:MAG: peptidylprolyl isomerase [Symploca sp. SIO2B6]|nr:peptidylprolyl isomerase [Symploca sp. SIO2B6]